ncbi:hypothetical protein [Sneathiella chinensis]|uniref:BZIP domain-containing protein n=1 Tax=Sneathiella chinensis TaxID=349750 RepID=A0ABQ5U0Y4_9PROT|nr:hypothetical protein [Sneathiella chinensis]GLQ05519.1 hypothetical protein GCM10007924_07400 [Sneathiella chinensis]
MNFTSKKPEQYILDSPDLSEREKSLIAENRKLRRKNKRLSQAMLYLVDQIEVKFNALNRAYPTPAPTAQEPAPAPIATPAPAPVKQAVPAPKPASRKPRPKVSGTLWQPEKLIHSRPVRKTPTPETAHPLEEPEILMARGIVTPEPVQEAAPPAPAPSSAMTHGPDLAPEEVSLLSSPRENRKPLPLRDSAGHLVKREAKKTSAEEASNTYLSVSLASRPTPDIDIPEPPRKTPPSDLPQPQESGHRAAMMRRVNRLRW